jgi:hypothetical protein
MKETENPKITQHGFTTIYEYEDGKKIIESNEHRLTTYPDGTMEAELAGGHKTRISPNGDTNTYV